MFHILHKQLYIFPLLITTWTKKGIFTSKEWAKDVLNVFPCQPSVSHSDFMDVQEKIKSAWCQWDCGERDGERDVLTGPWRLIY